jgi:Bifunctional DNA primase/polymerase, N-terminal/AAA domain
MITLEQAEIERLQLHALGYSPVPVKTGDKGPHITGWQKLSTATADDIKLWSRNHADHSNTGILTERTPVIDIDLLDKDAGDAVENLIRDRFGDCGTVLVRVGKAPKRAIPFQTARPFGKIQVSLTNASGVNGDKIELLCDGQQLVAHGIHKDTGMPYAWLGAQLHDVERYALPHLSEAEARELVRDIIELLTTEYGYTITSATKKAETGNYNDQSAEWGELIDNIVEGSGLHDSTRDLAAKLVSGGLKEGAAVNLVRSIMDRSKAPRDSRYRERYDDVPNLARSAGKFTAPDINLAELPLSIDDWLKRDLPAPDNLIGNWLRTTSRVLFAADTGVGKTNWLLAAFLHTGAGRDFLHWSITQARRALYIDGEMSRRLLKQRVQDAVRRLGISPIGFHALSHEDIENFQPLNTEAGQKIILDIVRQVGAEAVAFDNIMALIVGDMKEEEAWRDTLPLVNQLTKQGVGQIWVHHTGHDASRSYGTKTREWRMDTVIHGSAVQRDDTDVSFLLEFRKARERTPNNRGDFADVKVALVNDQWVFDVGKVIKSGKASPVGMKFLLALQNALASPGTTRFQSWKAVTMDQWRAECRILGLVDKEKADSERSLMSRHRRELIGCNLIACHNDLVWII